VIFAMVITTVAAPFLPLAVWPADRIGCDFISVVTQVQEVSCSLTFGPGEQAA
jgi:hypothetical protein